MERHDDPHEGWPKQFTPSAARDYLNEKMPVWAGSNGRDLGEFRPPLVPGIEDGGKGRVPWFPQREYWAFAPPPLLDRWRLTVDPGGKDAEKEPVANLIACAAWVARRQQVLDRLRQSGGKRLARLLSELQDELRELAVQGPELLTEPAFAVALLAASEVAPLMEMRTPSRSLERGVRLDDVPTKLAWHLLTHAGLTQRLATVAVVGLGLEGGGGWSSQDAVRAYTGLRERLRKARRREEYLPAAIAHLWGARFAPGPIQTLDLLHQYGRREAPDTVGLKKCFVVDLAARHLAKERGELPKELGAVSAVLTGSPDEGSFGAANPAPLAEIADLVERARRRHKLGSLSVSDLDGTVLGRTPGQAVGWLLRSRASLAGREVPRGITLVEDLAELLGEGVALDFLSSSLSILGDPPIA